MALFRPDIPPHIAESIRHFPLDLKRSIKQAIRSLSTNPATGKPLGKELEGFRKYRVRRFRIVYEIDRRTRTVRILAIGHRRHIYEEAANLLRQS